MAVYYKFKSARDYDSIPIEGQFISVANLKERIFESKHLGRGTDFDLMVSNAQTNEEYVDDAAMIPKNTSVLIRRIPGRPRKPIVTEPDEPKVIEDKVEDVPPPSSTMLGDSSIMKYPEESEWDEFGTDLYAIPEVTRAQTSNPVMDVSVVNKVDEDSKIKALIDTPALDWNRQAQDGYGAGRGFGRGMGGRMGAGRGFGRGGLERRTPPAGYVCHRCKVPGHFIQHCPTNGDPNFDLKRTKPPTGIPKSMLMASSDGSYALPTGGVAVLKPNEAAFEKEIEGLPTTRPVTDFPPELKCSLCKEVMKDAVLTSKCCFRSFCDKCIRDYIITKTMCVCGATNILADDLLPNRTLRETISRIMESATSSTENVGSLAQVPDMESARPAHPKVPSPTLSAASKDGTKQPMIEHSSHIKERDGSNESKAANIEMNSSDKKATINEKVSEAAPELLNKEKSLESAPVVEDVQEKHPVGEQGKKKKKKKMRVAGNASDMQWKAYQDNHGTDNFGGMPLAAPGFNPYWSGGMPLAMDPYMTAPFGGGPMPFMNYAPTPFDVPFGGLLPQDPFAAQNYMMPGFPRDLSDMNMGINQGPPIMSREEFEARKAELRRKREMERRNEREREFARDREARKESSSINDSPLRSKPRNLIQADRPDRPGRSDKTSLDRHGPNRDSSRDSRHSPHRPSKRKSSDRDEPPPPAPLESSKAAAAAAAAAADRKQKASVFSRISFPDSKSGEAAPKKRKGSSSSELPPKNGLKEHRESSVHKADGGYYDDWKSGKGSSAGSRRGGGGGGGGGGGTYDHESSEEEYHFKRRPSSSSSRRDAAEREDEGRVSKGGSREREAHERGGGREHDHYHERPSSKRR